MAKRKPSGARSLVLKPPRRSSSPSAPALGTDAAPLYAVHPAIALIEKWTAELPLKTGRSLDSWLAHIRSVGPKGEAQCRVWLAAEFSFGAKLAGWLASKAMGRGRADAVETAAAYLALAPAYVKQMYAGPRARLMPIHDELIRAVRQLGPDVRICPCRTSVPLYRRRLFAEIEPAGRRIALRLALDEEPFTPRLCDAKGLCDAKDRARGPRLTHQVVLASQGDIDLQVKRWLKQAYQRDG